jgi:hypothetical protein
VTREAITFRRRGPGVAGGHPHMFLRVHHASSSWRTSALGQIDVYGLFHDIIPARTRKYFLHSKIAIFVVIPFDHGIRLFILISIEVSRFALTLLFPDIRRIQKIPSNKRVSKMSPSKHYFLIESVFDVVKSHLSHDPKVTG